MDKKKQEKRGGLEFVPLPKGRDEEFFQIPHGRSHPGQLSLFVMDRKKRRWSK